MTEWDLIRRLEREHPVSVQLTRTHAGKFSVELRPTDTDDRKLCRRITFNSVPDLRVWLREELNPGKHAAGD